LAKILFVEPSGSERLVDVPDGLSLMQAATMNGVEGMEASCGGFCACATCHCYVDEAALSQIEPPNEMEMVLLENVVAERRPGSRLGCQVKSHPGLDGLVVQMPEKQS